MLVNTYHLLANLPPISRTKNEATWLEIIDFEGEVVSFVDAQQHRRVQVDEVVY